MICGMRLALLVLCAFAGANAAAPMIGVQFGSNMPEAVVARVTNLLSRGVLPVQVFEDNGPSVNISSFAAGSFFLSLGNSTFRNSYIPQTTVASAGPEGYALRACLQSGVSVFVGDGNPHAGDTAIVPGNPGGGMVYVTYEILRLIGFGFLHPLQPLIPGSLNPLTTAGCAEIVTSSPFWPIRGFHVHTMHPLELTNMFNGWGINGTEDEAGFQSMLPEFSSLLEWLVANKQNRLEWVILAAEEWEEFASSPARQARMATLTSMAHSWGIAAGADIPIALIQQHSWAIITGHESPAESMAKIQARMAWLNTCGFDYVSTESGTSEFTHPDDKKMVLWMNQTTEAAAALGKRVYIKCHCSTGQVCKDYVDPITGKPLNFNFLPIMADPRLGIMPHTVQFYAFDDPAPTYGNTNFTYMLDFALQNADKREVVYHPESAYWIDYDINVPLFLPVYASSRLRDARTLAQAQKAGKGAIHGIMEFDSGWEYGYWLTDVIAANAAWDPQLAVADESAALMNALARVTAVFGSSAESLSTLLVSIITAQRALLIDGTVNGQNPSDISRRNGQAYLEGWDTWADIGDLNPHALATQPTRLGIEVVRDPLASPNYKKEVQPLLAEMETTFSELASRFAPLRAGVPAAALSFFDELADSTQIVALRAAQVHALYDYAATWEEGQSSYRAGRKAAAEAALANATTLIARREANYRVPLDRIAGWHFGPTAYVNQYLWTAKTLFFWWRDYAQALLLTKETISPCYLNFINPTDVMMGEGIVQNATALLYELLEKNPQWGPYVASCLEPPTTEPVYPKDLYSQ